MPKPLFHHAFCCRGNTGCLREGGRDSCQGHHGCAISLTNISLDMYRGELWVGTWLQKSCGQEQHPESGMAANPWIQVCNVLSRGHFLLSVVFSPKTRSSGSSLGKEKGQPVLLCGLYFYGMLLLKSAAALLPGKHTRPTRAQVCSLWVARLHSLKNIQKTP